MSLCADESSGWGRWAGRAKDLLDLAEIAEIRRRSSP
jgi:hypothetical protein